MKEYNVKYFVSDSVAEELNQAHEILKKKGYCFSSEKMLDVAIHYYFLSIDSINDAVEEFCAYAERVAPRDTSKHFPED